MSHCIYVYKQRKDPIHFPFLGGVKGQNGELGLVSERADRQVYEAAEGFRDQESQLGKGKTTIKKRLKHALCIHQEVEEGLFINDDIVFYKIFTYMYNTVNL